MTNRHLRHCVSSPARRHKSRSAPDASLFKICALNTLSEAFESARRRPKAATLHLVRFDAENELELTSKRPMAHCKLAEFTIGQRISYTRSAGVETRGVANGCRSHDRYFSIGSLNHGA